MNDFRNMRGSSPKSYSPLTEKLVPITKTRLRVRNWGNSFACKCLDFMDGKSLALHLGIGAGVGLVGGILIGKKICSGAVVGNILRKFKR